MNDGTDRDEVAQAASGTRLRAIVALLVAAAIGHATARALSDARTVDAFAVAPTPAALGGYAAALAGLVGLALAAEILGPRAATRGARIARGLRAAFRRRIRRGRTRAEIAKVEVGLSLSLFAILLVAILAAAGKVAILVAALPAALVAARAPAALCRLVSWRLGDAALTGFLLGVGVGAALG